MTEKQAIWKSILHWRRMIKWVEKQDKGEQKDGDKMEDAIGDWWVGGNCALCELHYQNGCHACSLYKKYGYCDGAAHAKNAYRKTRDAATWGKWLYHARHLLKQLESLRDK